jgi:hypothetical protein
MIHPQAMDLNRLSAGSAVGPGRIAGREVERPKGLGPFTIHDHDQAK